MAAPSDGPSGGPQDSDSGFQSFPRSLSENCVYYRIYILEPESPDIEQRKILREILAATKSLTKRLLEDFIWHKDAFDLELVRENGLSYLGGHTIVGDSVEDEWLIVYLLREMSKQFPATWTKVDDTDGEFLLIEAANTLPRWLDPEVADNRVWIHDGRLRVIPQQVPAAGPHRGHDACRPLLLQDALDYLRSGASGMLRLPLVEEEAFDRVQKYPEKISGNLQRSLVTIPRKVAYLLHQQPRYLSSAVEAFYIRDPIALQPLQKPGEQGLEFPPEDFVSMSVTFNVVGYAQTKSQHFPPPLRWAEAIPNGTSATEAARAEMGMKIACGFEMLVSDPGRQDDRTVRAIKLLLADLQSAEAKLPTDAEIATWDATEDDSSWMDIDFRDFENVLAGREKRAAGNGFGDQTTEENLQKMVAKFESFLADDTNLDASSDLEEMDRDNDEDGSDTSEVSSDGEDKDASFSEDEFTQLMREMMGMPKETMAELMGENAVPRSRTKETRESKETRDSQGSKSKAAAESDDEEEIRQLSQAMEAELKAAGALRLNESTDSAGKAKQLADSEAQAEESDEEHENLDEGYNLVKNMLESFKSQGGLAGPGGNLMGMMGMQLPRDEESLPKKT